MQILSHLIKSIILAIPVGMTLLDYIGYIARVEGISMQPVLNPNPTDADYVFISRWNIQNSNIQRGDIVALTLPQDPKIKIIKRVIGLQGDIMITLGRADKEYIEIPNGHCWIEGDQLNSSFDSKSFGPVSEGLISGKAKCIIWPPKRWNKLNSVVSKEREPIYKMMV